METSVNIMNLVNIYCNLWWKLDSTESKYHAKSYTYTRKWYLERELVKLIKSVVKEVEKFPPLEKDRTEWKEGIKDKLKNFSSDSNIFDESDLQFFTTGGFVEATDHFYERAKKFDETLSIEDIGQAIRNVWIMNIIQALLNKPVECTPAVFAYSMLYPYTDNYLDNCHISSEEKLQCSIRFESRLRGLKLVPANKYEEKIFSLVQLIEEQYDRKNYPEVYGSLLGIHHAQVKSLEQQEKILTPYENNILAISIEKGGISVLADAYLVNGSLTPEEAEFFFVYGFLLQICDDLQDTGPDMFNGHNTIFSQTAKAWPLDNVTNKLLNLIDYAIRLSNCLHCPNLNKIQEIIRKNCFLLVLFAIAKNKKYFSKSYFETFYQFLPFRTSFTGKLYKKFQNEMKRLAPSYYGIPLEKIIMFSLKE